MSESLIFLTALMLVLFLAVMVFIFWALKLIMKMQEMNLTTIQRIQTDSLTSMDLALKSLKDLQDKSLALLSVKEPIAFQQIQAMSPSAFQEPQDNSEQGEMQRWVDDNPELTPMERAAFNDIPSF